MCEAVMPLMLGRLIAMPVIEKQVMEQACPCACTLIKPQTLAKLIVIVRYVQAMLKAGSLTVVWVAFHTQDNIAAEQVCHHAVIVAFVFAFDIDVSYHSQMAP